MEFVNGRTLKEVLAAEQRLQPRRALEIIADICAALEFSHRHGIIHRDIKPGNVMITQNGQVKVMDFGIARALASGATTMTQTSAVIGTAQYLSPEQARGESVDARSDVYAAGCVLFELLVGHPPFVGDSPVSVAYQHVREDPKAPSDISREVSPDIDAIVLKALAKNPLNRYQSAQEMRADALRAVAGRPVMATPVMSEAETMAMSGPPMRQQTAMTRAIPASVGPRGPQPADRKTSSWVMAVLAALGVLAVVALGIGLYLSGRNSDPDPVANVAVPKVTELSESDARDRLTAAGFQTITVGEPIETDDCKNRVERQSPAATESVPVTTPVTLQLCSSPALTRVPSDLNGSTKEAAQSALTAAKLDADFQEVDSELEAGRVVSVEKAGQQVKPGTNITVKISRGNLTEVPSVVGETVDVARALLQQAGFENIEIEETNQVGKAGTVVSQTPNAKQKRAKTTKVTLTVIAEDVPDPGNSGSPDPDDSDPPDGDGGGAGTGAVGGLLNR
jgi:serine/threonine-protein kinase